MKTFRALLLAALSGPLMGKALAAASAPADTVRISAAQLNKKALLLGRHTYAIYVKKRAGGPSTRIMLAKMEVGRTQHNGQPAVSIGQRWELDTVVHSATTLLNANDFSTLRHETYWKRQGYTATYDFGTRTAAFAGPVADSVKQRATRDFLASFAAYNLNWHSDLVLFPLLPYRDNVVFVINFYDPGAGPAQRVAYAVTGSATLHDHQGQARPCWVMQQVSKYGTQKFWIDKRTREVLKEEDSFNGQFRYKLKLAVSEEE